MLLRHEATGVRVDTPAKVNLFLEVLGRRPDGYHELATLMVKVSLYDSLELRDRPTREICLSCDLPGLSTGSDNLVCRAAALMQTRFGVTRGVDIHLSKRIPLAAGLAGGSSDAAATLAGLNRLWGLNRTDEDLSRLGAELGSDVSFFFTSTGAAWCTGRGEIIEPLRRSSDRPLDLVLVCPPVGLSTASVFGALAGRTEPPLDGHEARRAFDSGSVIELGRCLHNRLQGPAETLCPPIASLRQRLAALAPAGVLMSGSGSTVFALAVDPADALRISRAMLSHKDEGEVARVCVVRCCD